MGHYQEAAADPEMEAIALANFALAAFETRQDELAVRTARQLLRRCAPPLELWPGLGVVVIVASCLHGAVQCPTHVLQLCCD